MTLHAEFLRGFDDAPRVLGLIRQYLGNPWDRITAEEELALEAAFEEADRGVPDSEPWGEDEARELAALLLSEQHQKPELHAFFTVWAGSVSHFAVDSNTMNFETFAKIFGHVAVSCRLPDLTWEGERPSFAPYRDPITGWAHKVAEGHPGERIPSNPVR